MADATLKKLKKSLSKMEKGQRSIRYVVVVWGPGDDAFLKRKRRNILKKLKGDNFDAYMGEEFIKLAPSTLPLPEQELAHWNSVDTVIVIEAGIAPAMEISSYSLFHQFIPKCIVFHPQKYDPVNRSTYPSSVLGLFPYRISYTDDEFKKCTIIDECLLRVNALRRVKWLQSLPRSPSFNNIISTY